MEDQDQNKDPEPTSSNISIYLGELAHQDHLLQSYRQQFLVAETFAAAVAINALFDRPLVSFTLSILGVALLIGWIMVTYHRTLAVEHWRKKLNVASTEHTIFYKSKEKQALPSARGWFGGANPEGKLRIGTLQLIFIITWIMLDSVSIYFILR